MDITTLLMPCYRYRYDLYVYNVGCMQSYKHAIQLYYGLTMEFIL